MAQPDEKYHEGSKDHSLEKGLEPGYAVPVGDDDDDRYHFSSVDTDLVQRRLKQRHVQMYVPQNIHLFPCTDESTGLP